MSADTFRKQESNFLRGKFFSRLVFNISECAFSLILMTFLIEKKNTFVIKGNVTYKILGKYLLPLAFSKCKLDFVNFLLANLEVFY